MPFIVNPQSIVALVSWFLTLFPDQLSHQSLEPTSHDGLIPTRDVEPFHNGYHETGSAQLFAQRDDIADADWLSYVQRHQTFKNNEDSSGSIHPQVACDSNI